jgi:glutathione S-transferase
MAQFTLVIGNKNYSSWSLRPWLVMKQSGIEFLEVRIPLDTPTTHQEILKYSPTGKVPVLKHGDLTIWDSLAICEYVAEVFPPANLWTQDGTKRAIARSISAEMHSGFANLRQHLPMNCRARFSRKEIPPKVQADIERITTIWRECREKFANEGDFLFGTFTIADAMFAPVALRFVTYDVKLDPISSAYVEQICTLPAMQEWLEAASLESEYLEQEEIY